MINNSNLTFVSEEALSFCLLDLERLTERISSSALLVTLPKTAIPGVVFSKASMFVESFYAIDSRSVKYCQWEEKLI